MESVNVLQNKQLTSENVNKVTNIKTEQLGVDTYYFEPGQVLKYHKHPGSDQVFFFLEGQGKFYLETGGKEEVIEVRPGSIVLAPGDAFHQVENTGSAPLVASQVTKLPATAVQK